MRTDIKGRSDMWPIYVRPILSCIFHAEMTLNSPQLISFLLLLPLLFLSVFVYKKKKKHNNGSFLPPSPPKLPIIGNLHQLGELPHQSLAKLSKKYGPIMQIQLGRKPTLVVSSAEMAKQVLKTHDANFCSRPSLVGPKRLSYNFLDFAFAPYSAYWKEVRKICVLELFNVKRVQSFGLVREEEVAKLVQSVSASMYSPINLTEKLLSLTSCITCRVAFGKTFDEKGFNGNRFEEIVYEATDMLGGFTATDFFPYFGWIIDVVTGQNTRLERCFKIFDAFYQKIIDEHLDPQRRKPEQEDIIDVLLRLMTDQGTAICSTTHIKGILMNIFLAGVDTSAATMVWAMTELARKPEVMKKVQEEIRNCVGAKGKVEESDIEKLQYLRMVVKETLRFHPPTPLLIPHESMNHCKINGYDIYPNTRVLVNVWAIARSSEHWENPDKFLPERFMNSSIDFKGQDFEFLPFGSGRRMCPAIGMGVAIIELALANLLFSFNWELPTGMTETDISIDEVVGSTIHKKFPLHLVPVKSKW